MGSGLGSRFRCKTPGRLGVLGSALFGGGLRWIEPNQVKFAPVQQFPLDGFTGLHSDGGSQGDGEVDVEPGGGALGANGLHF
jgi:hypothetical protein